MYIKYLRPRNTDERSPVVCTGSDGQGSSLHLVAHLADRFRGRPHKPHPRVVARLRKVRALREKAVAWVDGIHVVFLKAKPEQKVNPCFHGARRSTQAEHLTQRQSEQSSKKRWEPAKSEQQLPSWTERVSSGSLNTVCSQIQGKLVAMGASPGRSGETGMPEASGCSVMNGDIFSLVTGSRSIISSSSKTRLLQFHFIRSHICSTCRCEIFCSLRRRTANERKNTKGIERLQETGSENCTICFSLLRTDDVKGLADSSSSTAVVMSTVR